MRKGFTLVELSIVLVVIGLLVGGILVGQSLIDSVKVSREVSRLQQYSIAIIAFRQKFKQEPGDSNRFTPPGNGNFVFYESGSCPSFGPAAENYVWLNHLVQAQMVNEKLTWDQTIYCAGGSDSRLRGVIAMNPKQKIAPDYFLEYGYSQTDFIAMGHPLGGGMHRFFWTAYDPSLAWGIENKIDDGVPSITTGKIHSSVGFALAAACTPQAIEAEPVATNKFCEQVIYFSPSIEVGLTAK